MVWLFGDLNKHLEKPSKISGSFRLMTQSLRSYYLALNNVAKKWSMPIQNWKSAMNHFIIEFGDNIVNM
jgi:putative transposase